MENSVNQLLGVFSHYTNRPFWWMAQLVLVPQPINNNPKLPCKAGPSVNGESFQLCEHHSFKLLSSNHIILYSFRPSWTTTTKKNANLTQFKKQKGQRFQLKWGHFYSCHLCLGHRHLIFKWYSLWELDFQYFVSLAGFKFQILPCVKISFQSVCPRRMIMKPRSQCFFRWTFLKMSS